jgi:hypothetical protein
MAQFDEDRNELYLTDAEEALMSALTEVDRDIKEYVRFCVESGDDPDVDVFIGNFGYNPTEKGYDDLADRIEKEAKLHR